MSYTFGPLSRDDGIEFRLWGPEASSVSLRLYDAQANRVRDIPLSKGDGGWWSSESLPEENGRLYHFCVDGESCVPDPASRFQPFDVHGPSMLLTGVGGASRESGTWGGRPWHETVLYELHLSTFTPEGSYAAAEEKLAHLADLGITAVELMPLSDFSGKRNWGYDGVLPYAPDSSYGSPEELRSFIQRAHGLGLMVFLDVVYNHFGPEGNYLHLYAPEFFTEKHQTPWGAAIDFSKREVRRFFIENAIYWLKEYTFDGLRFDAVHAIRDDSSTHILDELWQEVRKNVDDGRHIHLVLENDANEARYLAKSQRKGYDAQWNDDSHHIFHVIATGEDDGYYADYSKDRETKLLRCLTEGFIYQGEASSYREGEKRGERTAGLPLTAFVDFLQNHDQVGNRPFGDRLTALSTTVPNGMDRLVALQSVLLLCPQIPMLFMGEEWGSKTPFLYFCDYASELGRAVTEGRRREFAGFSGFSDEASRARIPDPNDPATFAESRLRWADLEESWAQEWLIRTKRLLSIRRESVQPLLVGGPCRIGGAVSPAPGVIQVRWDFEQDSLSLTANLSDHDQEVPWTKEFFGADARGDAPLGNDSLGDAPRAFEEGTLDLVGRQVPGDGTIYLGPWSAGWRKGHG